MKNKIKKYVPAAAIVLFILFGFCVLLQIAFRASPTFADFYNRYIGGIFRIVMAKATDWIPFSLAEGLLYLAPVVVIVFCVKLFQNIRGETRYFVRCVFGLLSVLTTVNSIFALNFAAGYHGATLADKLHLEDRAVTAEELYDTISIVIDELNAAAADVTFSANGSSHMPWNYFELSDVLCNAYKPLYDKYSFLTPLDSSIKPLVISPLMTYTHISGVYTFFTGEANLNTNYPDYVCAYSAAHELAHQRGIAREDEANFIAFLVCTGAEEPYLRYSGYLSMYSYLSSALYRADPALHEQAISTLDASVRGELAAYSIFFDKYRENVASKVSDTVNNTYLQSQGTAGSVSYGMVVDLAVSYYLDK